MKLYNNRLGCRNEKFEKSENKKRSQNKNVQKVSNVPNSYALNMLLHYVVKYLVSF